MKTIAVVVGAGEGRRLGGECKALLDLAGKPLICYSLEVFQKLERIDGVCVVVPPRLLDYFRDEFAGEWPFEKVFAWVAGGKRRQDSVSAALENIPEEVLWIAVHDVARPFITDGLVLELLDAALETGASVPGIRVVDTVKEVNDKGMVVKSLERERLRAIQTPQVFAAEAIRQAYRDGMKSGATVTDDASLVEILGRDVKVIEGSSDNIKITVPEDLEGAIRIARRHGKR